MDFKGKFKKLNEALWGEKLLGHVTSACVPAAIMAESLGRVDPVHTEEPEAW